MKQLRKFLFDRGLECKGCAEKEDYVKMVYDNREKPEFDFEAVKRAAAEDKARKEKDKIEIDEVISFLV